MGNKSNQIASASEESILAENHPQSPLPREYERRWETGQQLKSFINEKEMLRRLPISRKTLFNWRRAKKIPSIIIGRRILFCWDSVAEALRRLESGGEQ